MGHVNLIDELQTLTDAECEVFLWLIKCMADDGDQCDSAALRRAIADARNSCPNQMTAASTGEDARVEREAVLRLVQQIACDSHRSDKAALRHAMAAARGSWPRRMTVEEIDDAVEAMREDWG